MIRIRRFVVLCEITAAMHLGAFGEWWAGRAYQRLRKIGGRP